MVPEEDVARRSVFMKDALEQSWRRPGDVNFSSPVHRRQQHLPDTSFYIFFLLSSSFVGV